MAAPWLGEDFAARQRELDVQVKKSVLELVPIALGVAHVVVNVIQADLESGLSLFSDGSFDSVILSQTLQAVRQHQKVDPFTQPGESDLTAHVDFSSLAPIAQSRGCRWLGTVPQGRWLRNLGIEARAQSLAAQAPEHAAALAAAQERLVGEGQMGLLFKVMGLAAPSWPGGAGF